MNNSCVMHHTRGIVEAIGERRPDLVDAIINALPPVGDEAEAMDLKLWSEGSAYSAYCVLWRRCGCDESMVRVFEDALLDKIMGGGSQP